MAGCHIVVCCVLQPCSSKWLQVASLLSSPKWAQSCVFDFNMLTADVSVGASVMLD
jgi:hypothetical protein